MKNSILLKKRPVLVKGHVIVDYVRKDKILERVEGDNMCFDTSFNAASNWGDLLFSGANTMVIYASDKAADPAIPFLRYASRMGWGVKSAAASGTTQGAWNATKSYDCKVINSGNGVSFKWAYDWGVTQMLGNQIKSLGIGYAGVPLFLNRAQLLLNNDTSWVMKGYIGNKINISGVKRLINRRNIKTNEILTEIDVSSKVKTDNVSGDTWSMGFAHDNNKAYIMLYNTNAAQAATRRLLYEFTDSTFTTLQNTYTISAMTTYPTAEVKGFIIFNNKMYIPNHDIVEYNYITNVAPLTFPAPTAIVSGSDFTNFSAQISLLCKPPYIIRTRKGQYVPVFNLATRSYEPEACYIQNNNSYNENSYFEPLIGDEPLVHTGGIATTLPTHFLQMFSCFKLPANSPDRPEDSGVSIDYQIDIIYQ